MLLGALVDAGVPLAVLDDAVSALSLGARLSLRRVDRSGISAAKVDVVLLSGELAETASAEQAHGSSDDPDGAHSHRHEDEVLEGGGASDPDHPPSHDHGHDHGHGHDHDHDHQHPHANEAAHGHAHGRSLSVIRGLIKESPLSAEVQSIALQAFQLLGEAEAKIHNVPIESIHFHEVGAVDAIADIVAASAGCYWLGVDRWLCSPLNVGGGHVHCAHGKFPVPAPATLELLRDLPVYSSGVKKELVTPTGAALLRALEVTPSASFPAMSMKATGYGAGSRELPGQPNVLRLVVGESLANRHAMAAGESESGSSELGSRVGIIETTVDDATPEVLAYAADRLLAAGASEVYRTAVQMKKGRSGTQLTVLCAPAQAAALQRLVFEETTTLGLRYREERKTALARSLVAVETEWGSVRMKIGAHEDGSPANYAPEFEDCRSIAERYGVPLKEVMQRAIGRYLADRQRT